MKTATCSDVKSAADSGRKTATNFDMITPIVYGSFWKWRIVAIDPFLTFEALRSMSVGVQ
ncbi:MAG: hypothetical protein HOO92_04535 [Methylococcaceae bacterium]|nr:hypothetical protein [Methylococcaceae bacterium]